MKELSADVVREIISYDPESGDLKYLQSRGPVKSGSVIKRVSNRGYITVKILGKTYQAHRVAWLIHYGEWPVTIDHINRDRTDNRLVNLRNATQQQNMCNVPRKINNTSGVRGVSWKSQSRKWQVEVKADGKRYYLGSYADIEFAELVASEGRVKLHKEFASCIL